MNLSLCTISFRHQLRSLEEIASWGGKVGFRGIELWATHARSLMDQNDSLVKMLRSKQMHVSMLSDYISYEQSEKVFLEQGRSVLKLVTQWHCCKLRIFAGQLGSAELSELNYQSMILKTRALCEMASTMGVEILLEFHPNTYIDTLDSTLRFLEDVDHANLRINFDVLHVWEAGEDPVFVFDKLNDYISHIHLKNISSRDLLNVFAPANVYAASGSREGMVPLFAGQVDYVNFIEKCNIFDIDASLEWFGDDVMGVLSHDCKKLSELVENFSSGDKPISI